MHRPLSRELKLYTSVATTALLLAFGATNCGTNRGGSDSEPARARSVTQAATGLYDWLQFGGDSRHGGNNTLESKLTPQNVSGLQQLFKINLPETIEGAPVVLTNVSTPGGVHDIAFMTTRTGVILAIDAYTGSTIWSQRPVGGQITMSSPAVDPSRAFVYSTGLDGYLHKYQVGDGTEVTGNGWPELFTLKPTVEKGGTAMTIANVGGTNYLYMGTGGYDGDGGDYQGHVTSVNLSTGAQRVFNDMCSDQTIHFTLNAGTDCSSAKSGIWAKAGLTFDPATNRLYVATGNGTFNPGTHLWGDSLLALNFDGSGVNGGPVDSYTPSNFQSLQNADKDLGSTNMLIVPGTSKYPHLAAQSGKDQLLRLINLDNMSGQGGPGHVGGEISSAALPTGGENQNPSSTWVNPADNSTWVFIVSPANGINAFRISVDGAGNPTPVAMWHAGGGGGGAAIANNVLFYASDNNFHALNPTTGAELWHNTGIGTIHWQTPTIANGVVYIGDKGRQLTAFALNGETALSRAGWTATASQASTTAGNALDGNTGSRWSSGQAMANGMFLQVDMQSPKTFDQVSLDSGNGSDYPRGFQIFASNDPANFGSAIASGAAASQTVTVKFAQQNARYLKTVQTGSASNWWSVAELNVYTSGGGGTGGTGGGGSGNGGSGNGGSGNGGSGGSGNGGGGAGGNGGTNGALIDCGGPANPPYVADIDFTGGTTTTHANTIDVSGVTSPAPVAVYQSGRLGNFSYTVPGFVAGSSHSVRLHFAETYFSNSGSRVFNVSINGTQVLSNFDIVGTTGAKNKAVAPAFTVNANASGAYVIQATSVVNNSLLAGVEIH